MYQGSSNRHMVIAMVWASSLRTGPFNGSRSCILSALEPHAQPSASEADVNFENRILALFRLFIKWIPFEGNTRGPRFFL